MDGKMNQSEDELPGAKEQNSVEAVLAYHRRTKHHLHHYAASPGYLDWAAQPDPFRTYVGAERVELPLLADRLDAAYAELYFPGAVPAMPLERDSVGMLFELALGLSAWKQYQGSRWALRCNPSSGNLHPTEGYAILPQMPGRMPASTTTSAGTTAWSGAAFWKVERRRSWQGCSHQLPFSWVCLRFIGARPGNTASAPFATASTMSAMPWLRCDMRPPRWAGRPG